MIIEWFDITGFTNIHVYTYTPNYIYNSGVGGINWNWRENDYMSNNEHFGWSFFVWMFGDIYAIAKFPKFDTHSFPFKMWQVFSFCWKYSGWRWIFKEYSRCDFFTLKGRMGTQFSEMFWTFCNKISLLWFMEQKL